MARHLASVALGLFAERKQSAGQLLLPQRKKKIALVLALIESALEQGPAAIRARLQPGEMTGGDVLGAKLVGALDEPAEFKVLIAHDARVRCATCLVFVGEVMDDLTLKLSGFV